MSNSIDKNMQKGSDSGKAVGGIMTLDTKEIGSWPIAPYCSLSYKKKSNRTREIVI